MNDEEAAATVTIHEFRILIAVTKDNRKQLAHDYKLYRTPYADDTVTVALSVADRPVSIEEARREAIIRGGKLEHRTIATTAWSEVLS